MDTNASQLRAAAGALAETAKALSALAPGAADDYAAAAATLEAIAAGTLTLRARPVPPPAPARPPAVSDAAVRRWYAAQALPQGARPPSELATWQAAQQQLPGATKEQVRRLRPASWKQRVGRPRNDQE